MNARKLLSAAFFGALLLAPCARLARAAIVERVVAVVGERPILLSDLRHRARPFLFRIAASVPNPAQQAAAETEMFRDLLNKMIDERLEEVAADKAHLGVSSEEVDNAIKNIATNARLSVKDLVGEAKRQGLTEQDYRDEIRRQVLEGKLIQLRVRGRVRVTDQDARATYGRWAAELRGENLIDLRVLALRLGPTTTPTELAARTAAAQALVEQARGGADFCQLVASYSEDTQTKAACGSRGPQPITAFAGIPPIAAALQTLRPGEVSDPVVVPGEAVLLLQVAATPKLPAFADVKDQMMERAYSEAMERQRKLWLSELRRGLYIDVRL